MDNYEAVLDIDENYPCIFGIRHHSPAASIHLGAFLNKKKPKLILIEGPSDFSTLIPELMSERIVPPVAIMSYTLELPIRTILYPFAEYSPEYQAILYAKRAKCDCEFIDLPSGISLNLDKDEYVAEGEESGHKSRIYKALDEVSDDKDDETFWERFMEQSENYSAYMRGAYLYGLNLRELTLEKTKDDASNILREAYMRGCIQKHLDKGIEPKDIVVIVGAYHIAGLSRDLAPITDKELKSLKKLDTKNTLMPYSYYRLSELSGYGAGNHAPAYYELLWKSLLSNDVNEHSFAYLSKLAQSYRKHGGIVSSAQIIEAVELALNLAKLHDGKIPTLKDLKDAATTCMAEGSFAALAIAFADTEIGTKIGSLPEGLSQTSIQTDFNSELKRLKLEKYRSLTAQDLSLDLRENLRVKSESLAFIDLEKSFFLHRLRILGIDFATLQISKQDKATWAENWVLRWTPEAEIQIVEAVLKGDTIEQAVGFVLKTKLSEAAGIKELAYILEDAYYCGMPKALELGLKSLQEKAVDAVAIVDIGDTLYSLSNILSYGDIRKLDRSPLEPIAAQLFLRACLIMPAECICDEAAAIEIGRAIILINDVVVRNEFLDRERWIGTLEIIARRDDLNTRLSGLAMATLTELSKVNDEELSTEIQKRLSKGVPAELGANWFAGLAMKNRYALIARLSIWRSLSEYMDSLDEDEFKRALVSLRRAFADFDSAQKFSIAENLAEVWGLEASSVAEVLGAELSETEMDKLSELAEFDFDDI